MSTNFTALNLFAYQIPILLNAFLFKNYNNRKIYILLFQHICSTKMFIHNLQNQVPI